MTLYLKYRPQTIEELDLINVREQLKKIVNSENIPHAFLFAGPKGTGKTSAARILAKAINCTKPNKDGEPCNRCEQCMSISRGQNMDVVEMDAASNRGIDDIRALRENVNLAPTSAKKKIYILDEAHMLTTEAANAFLKTLEEPPTHAMFILATTDPQKLPSTIHSRLTKITFTKATKDEISRQLTKVINGEKLKIGKEAVNMIANAADGSFRDAVKIIEALTSEGKEISNDQVAKYLQHVEADLVIRFINLLANNKTNECLGEIDNLIAQGVGIADFVDNLIAQLRILLLAIVADEASEVDLSKERLIEFLENLLVARQKIAISPIEQLPLEILVVQLTNREPNGTSSDSEEPNSLESKKFEKKVKINKAIRAEKPVKLNGNVTFNKDIWAKVVLAAKEENATVDALLRAVTPIELKDDLLRLGVFYRFHKERLETNQHRRALEDIVSRVIGSQVRVACVLAEKKQNSAPIKNTISVTEASLTQSSGEDILKAAEEIFG